MTVDVVVISAFFPRKKPAPTTDGVTAAQGCLSSCLNKLAKGKTLNILLFTEHSCS